MAATRRWNTTARARPPARWGLRMWMKPGCGLRELAIGVGHRADIRTDSHHGHMLQFGVRITIHYYTRHDPLAGRGCRFRRGAPSLKRSHKKEQKKENEGLFHDSKAN